MSENWLALESNPEVMNDYVKKLGFNTAEFNFCDLYSTEDWAKAMIKKPVLGMVLIFPISKKTYDLDKIENKKIKEEGQILDKDLFFMKQKGMNSCGTVALYHILTNLPEKYDKLISEDSVIRKFKLKSKNKNPNEIGDEFVNNKEIKSVHKEAVEKGQTNVVEKVDKHFISFVHFNGCIYELDGRKEFAINHGKTTEEEFLDSASKMAKEFMNRDPESVEFGIIVLAKK